MKRSLLTIGVLGLLACGRAQSSPKETSVASTDKPAGTGGAGIGALPCTEEIARVCPDGFVDGCMTQVVSHHECVARGATPGPLCTEEIAMACPPGQVDICRARAAQNPSNHICILK